MNAQQINDTGMGAIAFTKATITCTLTGWVFLQALAIYRLAQQSGGFFLAPPELKIGLIAFTATCYILHRLSIELISAAMQFFRAAYYNSPATINTRAVSYVTF